jgi:dihydroorotate dehydrogenase
LIGSKLFQLAKPALFLLPPEQAHHLSIKALKSGLMPRCENSPDVKLQSSIAGLTFPNPIGIAAGYDKNGEVPDAILRMGFGFAEVGTITPCPQSGNPKPRIFRLEQEQAIINRLGFNNQGHDTVLRRLNARSGMASDQKIVGINIGANKDTDDFVADYVKGIEVFAALASYFTVNISSPNTPGLRNLQAADALTRLLDNVLETRDAVAANAGRMVPVFLKIAPDLDDNELDEIAAVVNASALDGVIISNTTIDRSTLAKSSDDIHAKEQGGLSGKPLFIKSTIVLAKMRQRLADNLPIIGVGGVDSVETTIAKMEAGADLVQIYTGLIYQGPGLPQEITRALIKMVDREKLNNIGDIVGRKTGRWAGL